MRESTDIVDTAANLAGLGPDRMEMTNQYIRSLTSLERADAESVATALGF